MCTREKCNAEVQLQCGDVLRTARVVGRSLGPVGMVVENMNRILTDDVVCMAWSSLQEQYEHNEDLSRL